MRTGPSRSNFATERVQFPAQVDTPFRARETSFHGPGGSPPLGLPLEHSAPSEAVAHLALDELSSGLAQLKGIVRRFFLCGGFATPEKQVM